jgi:ribosome-associated translation inhibitor RaiA
LEISMNAESKSRDRFPTQVAKPLKRAAGATTVGMTPLNVRVGKRVTLDRLTREHIERRMSRQLGKFALLIQRSTVRFDDVNGKKGGVDASCSIKVVLSARPDVVVEERATTPREAFDAAAGAAERAVRRSLGRAEMHARPSRRGRSRTVREDKPDAVASAAPPNPPPEDGSYIGARVGRGAANLALASERPEKRRRDSLVDTAQVGVSAADRKAGGGSTARRNSKLNTAGMTSALEDSAQSTPSRKSTRRSANRSKRDSNLERREIRKLHSAKARARRDLAS